MNDQPNRPDGPAADPDAGKPDARKPDARKPDARKPEQLLDELAPGIELEAGAADPAGRERREYLELLGLLGASVEPVEPPLAIRERLLAALGGPAAVAPAAAVEAMPAPAGAASGATSSRWALPLAASLAVALAGFAGYQAAQLAGQQATIERLSERLEAVEARTPTVAAMRGQIAEMQERMALVTARGVEICPLRPMPAEPQLAADSHGVLYVAADHQHWYLTIEGLKPCAQGRSYQLWFVTADGEPVSAGTFDVGEGVRVELSSKTMPAATRAVTVTLEPAGGSPAPSGPAVLHGDEVMTVL